MTNRLIIMMASLLAFFTDTNLYSKDAPASAEELRSRFEATVKAKDAAGLKELVNWESVSGSMKKMIDHVMTDLTTRQVASVSLAALPAGMRATNEVNGVRYRPNVELTGMVRVNFAQKDNSMEMPYGSKGGAFYISGTVEERFATPTTKEKVLNVSVVGVASGGVETFRGSYVYVKGGKEITEDFHGMGNLSKGFWGDYVKLCTITKLTDADWLTLVIMENGKEIYNSGRMTKKGPVVYQRK